MNKIHKGIILKNIFVLLLTSFFVASFSIATDLRQERIWKLSTEKRSVYFNQGIFHHPGEQSNSTLKSVRNSYVAARGFERIVFDLESNLIPKIYGQISPGLNRVFIDFLDTKMSAQMNSLSNGKFVKGIDFFNIESRRVSVELHFEANATFDIFYLNNPARLVLDVKK